MNAKGKYKKTSSIQKTDLIRVSFKLLYNNNIASGQKHAYIVLLNPKGKVVQAKGVFKLKGSEVEKKYTDYTVLNYRNNDINVIMYIQRKGNKFEKGIYKVELFLEGQLVAVSNLNLSTSV